MIQRNEIDWKVFLRTPRGTTIPVIQKALDSEIARILVDFHYKEVGCKSFYAEAI